MNEVRDESLVVGLQFGDEFLGFVAMAGGDGVADLDEGIGRAAERAEYDDLWFLSAVISWLTCRIRSGLPTEVPPNFMILNWVILFFWRRAKIGNSTPNLMRQGFQVFDDGGNEGDAFGEAMGFHFTFGVPGDEHFLVTGRGGGAAKAADPVVHMCFEFCQRGGTRRCASRRRSGRSLCRACR